MADLIVTGRAVGREAAASWSSTSTKLGSGDIGEEEEEVAI